MTPYTYIIYPHTRSEVLWATDIDDAIRQVNSKMTDDQIAFICSFGGTDLIEIGKRAVN